MNNHKLLEGNPPSKRVLAQIKKNIKEKKLSICLAIILIGDNSASKKYIEMKMAACKEVGIKTKFLDYTEFNEEEIIKKIKKLNEDKKITGILIQLPLLKELDTEKIINTIDPKKDVDGLTKINERNLESGKETLAPATPKGILKLLEGYGIKLENKKIVLVGMGKLVGYPLSIMLKNRKLNFTRQAFTFLNYIFNPIINLSPLLYERFFCWILPCAEVIAELEVKK